MNQIIKILSAVKICIKNENETFYDMNIITKKSARLFKIEWMKKVKCYNCREINHIKKIARNSKKVKSINLKKKITAVTIIIKKSIKRTEKENSTIIK